MKYRFRSLLPFTQSSVLSRAKKWLDNKYFRAAMVITLAVWFWRIIPWGGVIANWEHIKVLWLLLSLGCAFVSALAEIVSWGIWLPAPGATRWLRLSHYYMGGLFLNQCVPTGAASDVWRWVGLSKHHGRAPVLASLATARVLMFVSLIVWAAVAINLLPVSLKTPSVAGALMAVLVLSAGALLIITFLPFTSLRARLITRLKSFQTHFVGLTPWLSYRRWIVSIAFAGLAWGGMIFAVTTFAWGMGLHLSWPVITIGLIVSLAFSWIPWTPNGLGWRDGAFVFVLWHAGISTASAVAVSAFIDFNLLPLALIGGFTMFVRARIQPQHSDDLIVD